MTCHWDYIKLPPIQCSKKKADSGDFVVGPLHPQESTPTDAQRLLRQAMPGAVPWQLMDGLSGQQEVQVCSCSNNHQIVC